jgi:parallel beta-helix repeat protein
MAKKIMKILCFLTLFAILMSAMPVSVFALTGNITSVSDNFVHSANEKVSALQSDQEVKFNGTAIEYFSSTGTCSWNIRVEKIVSGPSELQGHTVTVALWSGGSGEFPSGSMDPEIGPGDKVEVFGLYVDDDYVTLSGSEKFYINVIAVGNPTANFDYAPPDIFANQKVTFDASTSYDPDGAITKYDWDFGDGTKGAGVIVTHSYTAPGKYNVVLTVTDDDSLTNSKSNEITLEETENAIYVPDDYLTIQQAVDAAESGETIIVRAGSYTENVVVNKPHLTIRSENGVGATIVQAANSSNPVFEITMDNVSIRGFTVKGTFSYVLSFGGDSFGAVLVRKGGIELKGSKSCNISNNICAHNSIGIYLMDSTNNIITENICSDNEEAGISLSQSNNNSVIRNECTAGVSCGILLEASKNNTISENKCSENQNGIMVYSPQSSESNLAANNIIIRNSLSDNEGGITLYVSYKNTITENNISNNDYGIILDWSNNDIIYLNNLNNEINVKFGSYGHDPSTDIWNSTSKITYTYNGTTYTNYLGNYWNDYNGDDVNKDGIGGISYLLDQDKDNYPLMGPFKDNTILPAPLTVMAGPDQTVNEGDTVSFSGSFNGPNTERYAMEWDFGDASIETGTLTPIHVYADNGVYTVTLTVTDHEGSVETDTLTVTVNNVAPTVNAGPNQTVGAGGTVTFSGSFTDPGTNDTHSIKWSFGDGGSASGTLTPTHTYIYFGTYAATLIVTDDDGARGIGTLTVIMENVG